MFTVARRGQEVRNVGPATESPVLRTGTESSPPVHWSSVSVGALAAIAVVVLFGFVGVAIGAHQLSRGTTSPEAAGVGGLILSVLGAFLAFVTGGWTAGKLAGVRGAKHAMIQGAVVSLAAIPVLLVLAAIGALVDAGSWYVGLVRGTMSGETADPVALIATRNAALGAVAALLLSLAGALVGGWLASSERLATSDRRVREIPAVGHAWPAD